MDKVLSLAVPKSDRTGWVAPPEETPGPMEKCRRSVFHDPRHPRAKGCRSEKQKRIYVSEFVEVCLHFS